MGVLSSREGCQEDQGHQGCQRWTIDSIATKEHLPEVRLRLEAATWKGKARIFQSDGFKVDDRARRFGCKSVCTNMVD